MDRETKNQMMNSTNGNQTKRKVIKLIKGQLKKDKVYVFRLNYTTRVMYMYDTNYFKIKLKF